MCGFAGVLDFSATLSRHRAAERLRGISQDPFARGPDETVIVADERMAVLHARLAIVGGRDGRQPLVSENRNRFLVFSGEIYNSSELAATLRRRHRFASRSDGEVLLHGYEEEGMPFFARVDGMFALVLRDLDKNEALLVRDRFGIKPLCWGQAGSRFAFATDAKSVCGLLDRPLHLSWRRALQMMGQPGHWPGPCWEDVQEVEPGTALVVRPDGLRPSRWFQFRYTPARASTRAIRRRYREALAESVRLQTDGLEEIGVALSGGLDSSILCGLSRRAPVGYVLSNLSTRRNGEVRAACQVAHALGLRIRRVVPADPTTRQRDYLDLLRFCESPDLRSEHLLKSELAQRARADGVRVLLSGQGSDEFNGGYSELAAGSDETHRLERYLRDTIVDGYRPQLLLANGIRPDLSRFLSWRNLDFLDQEAHGDLWEQELHRRLHMLRRYNLALEDRIAGRWGLENRVPFLGNGVAAVCWSIPRQGRSELLSRKAMLRALAEDVLPPRVARRHKVPFFHGPAAGATFAYLSRLLLSRGGPGGDSLVSAARQTRALSGRGALEPAAYDRLVTAVRRNPRHMAVEALCGLTNLALLSEGAVGRPALPAAGRLTWLGK